MPVVVPAIRRGLARKPMLLGAMDTATANWCLDNLPAAGLCLTLASGEGTIPEEHRAWLALHLKRSAAEPR